MTFFQTSVFILRDENFTDLPFSQTLDWMDVAGSLIPLAGSSCSEIPNAIPLGMTVCLEFSLPDFGEAFSFFSLSTLFVYNLKLLVLTSKVRI